MDLTTIKNYFLKKKIVVVSMIGGYIMNAIISFFTAEPLQSFLTKLPFSNPVDTVVMYYQNLENEDKPAAINNWLRYHPDLAAIRTKVSSSISTLKSAKPLINKELRSGSLSMVYLSVDITNKDNTPEKYDGGILLKREWGSWKIQSMFLNRVK